MQASLLPRTWILGTAVSLLSLAAGSNSLAQAALDSNQNQSETGSHLIAKTEASSTPAAIADARNPASIALPDTPQPVDVIGDERPGAGTPAVAPLYATTIPTGWSAQPLRAHDKVILGLRDMYSFDNIAAMFLSSGYSQVINGQPNYGSNARAYGKRLGAAAINETSESFFWESVFSPMLHEDSRYYVQGPQHNLFQRTLYAVTRPLITKTDSGRSTVNGGLLLGYAASAGLSRAYYPQINRNGKDLATDYAGSIGGAALGDFVNEFSQDFLVALHLRKAQ